MRHSIGWTRAVPAIALLGAVTPAAAADEAPLALPRLAGRVVVDGRLDEEAWKQVRPLPLTVYAPTYRGTPVQASEVRVAYDDEALYAAG